MLGRFFKRRPAVAEPVEVPVEDPVAAEAWSERRTSYRKAVLWPCSCRVRGVEYSGQVRDVGRGGALVATAAPVSVGHSLDLEIRHRGLTFQSPAMVVAVEDGALRVSFSQASPLALDVLSMLLAQ